MNRCLLLLPPLLRSWFTVHVSRGAAGWSDHSSTPKCRVVRRKDVNLSGDIFSHDGAGDASCGSAAVESTDAVDVWPYEPTIHLLIFVHRVEGLRPGLYFLVRDQQTLFVHSAIHESRTDLDSSLQVVLRISPSIGPSKEMRRNWLFKSVVIRILPATAHSHSVCCRV